MTRAAPDNDPVVRALREEISRADLEILRAANERLRLVADLREHKRRQGFEFVDRSREEQLLTRLVAENGGPLSEEAVRALFQEILDVTKRELGEPG